MHSRLPQAIKPIPSLTNYILLPLSHAHSSFIHSLKRHVSNRCLQVSSKQHIECVVDICRFHLRLGAFLIRFMLFKYEGQADKITKHNIRSQIMLKIILFYPHMNAFVWLSIHYLAHSMVYYSVAFSIYSNLSLISVEIPNSFGNGNDQLQDSRKYWH